MVLCETQEVHKEKTEKTQSGTKEYNEIKNTSVALCETRNITQSYTEK